MPYSVLYGISVAQIREDFATAAEVIARLQTLRNNGAVGIIVFDKSDTEINDARLAELAKAESGKD
ncbi:hypothetical protein AB6802_03350 [Mesorhizobium sp. RCC_202]|jgi:hypothetical protein|uniref:hypothetical protein n=1 Tax=Mesorhizobium sp. RCC_202 TaxID=3239222 RepID=UPI00352580F0